MRSYLSGSEPGRENLEKLWRATGAALPWLVSGEGAREGYDAPAPLSASQPFAPYSPDELFVYVPKYSVRAQAGTGTSVESEQIVDYLAFNAKWFDRNVGIGPEHAALIEVRGDSMTPVLNDGELVIVDTSCEEFKDDAIYVLQYSGALRIKSVRRRLDGKIEVKSANEDYGVEVLTEQEAESGNITIVGRARWALSGRRLP